MTRTFRKRFSIIALAFVLVMTSIVVFRPSVYAGGDYSLDNMVQGTNGDNTVNVGSVLSISLASLKAEMGDDVENLIKTNQVQVKCVIRESAESGDNLSTTILTEKDGKFSFTVPATASGKYIEFYTIGENSHYSANSETFRVITKDLGVLYGRNKDYTFYSGDEAYVTMSTLSYYFSDFETQYKNKKAFVNFYADDTKLTAFFKGNKFYYIVHPSCFGKKLKLVVSGVYNGETQATPVSTYIDFAVDKSGKVNVKGETTGANNFQKVQVDGSRNVLPASLQGKKKISFSFSVTDSTKYTVGLHELTGVLSDKTVCGLQKKLPVTIYARPVLNQKMFETYKNYLILTPGSFSSAKYGDLYIDYKKGKNGKWSTAWGPFSPNSPGKISKLSPGSVYFVRAYYMKAVNGSYYLGPVSKTIAIQTGPKNKPAVKSVHISKASVKRVWVKPILNIFGLVVKPGYYTYKTTYQLTVRFKKAPGVAGIEVYAGGVTLPSFIKGNKKTYKTTFTVGGNAIGKKTVFRIRTKGNKNYGAWSPFYKSKKVSIY